MANFLYDLFSRGVQTVQTAACFKILCKLRAVHTIEGYFDSGARVEVSSQLCLKCELNEAIAGIGKFALSLSLILFPSNPLGSGVNTHTLLMS